MDPNKLATLERRITDLYRKRVTEAAKEWQEATQKATQKWTADAQPGSGGPLADATAYWVDFAQRSAMFWDTMRRRGNEWLEHEAAGKPPLLVFDYETIADARSFERPANYALLRIIPDEKHPTDPAMRPFVIVDPRAGHGPGIGGFKSDSEVGVALKAGHPVYFVIFFPDPCPGQTLADVSLAEAEFLRIIAARHPDTQKPIVVGNCQGGWAVMLLGALEPDLLGPIVINGAPVSYWAGNDGENPMRYAGGALGGVWPALLASDLGGGVFDGAYLIDNFENLNPANTLVDKYYNLFSRVDTEPERFLEFERWWGGYFLMNRSEIKWIVENLFVGNRLGSGEAEWSEGRAFDLRAIRSPIIVFASMGDNITPPQQAINWVADLYPTTADLKANGQVIVGLMHESVGHLGIFVSGSIAKREHAQIVDLLDYINGLAPGLYAMEIEEKRGPDGRPQYDVTLTERQVEDLRKLQTHDRVDEIPFEAVDTVSRQFATAYETFVHPWLAPLVNPSVARAMRNMHPLRMQRWMFSDMNPFMAGVAQAATWARANRAPRPDTGPSVAAERLGVSLASAGLEFYRATRDAASEFAFFQIYGPLSMAQARPDDGSSEIAAATQEAIDRALSRIEKGGFPEAAIRMALLFAKQGTGRRRLSAMKSAREIVGTWPAVLGVSPEGVTELMREQSLIVEGDAERAFATLPKLLASRADRDRLLDLVRQAEEVFDVNDAQRALRQRLHKLLQDGAPARKLVAVPASDPTTRKEKRA
jgi:pimeloyl-ACP methyl ester carboxylesterase